MATAVETKTYQLYIDGEFVDAQSGESYEVHNPSNGNVIAKVAAAGPQDAAKAIAAARRAFDNGEWRNKTQLQRSQIMFEIADYLNEHCEDWPLVEAQNAGATIRKTGIVDVPLAIAHFRHLAEQALQLPWYEPLPWNDVPAVSWNFVQREPVGVCTGIIPFNFPLLITMWKLAPALAMGNSIVIKPSPLTPLSALELAKAIDTCGLLPKGVFNVVTGPSAELGQELVVNEQVDKVSFTGSTKTGRKIMELAAGSIKKITLELGGKSCNIVCEDADLELAVDGAIFANFFHQGQACEAGTRTLVHEKIYDQFVKRLVEKAQELRVGDATDIDTQVGPLISQTQLDNVLQFIESAKKDGGRILCGGKQVQSDSGGYFFEPTVITDLADNANCTQEEIFGPVAVIQSFRDEAEVIQRANATKYGLAGGVWSQDTRRAISIAKQLRTGTVWINDWHILNSGAPFGGYGQSGLGRELGVYGLKEYTEVKHIHVDLGVPREERFFYDVVQG